MTVDKRINYVGGGSLYQGGSGVAGSAEAPKPSRKTYTSKNIDSKPVTGADYKRSRKQFIDKFNQDRTAALGRKYKPIGLDRFGSSNQLGAKGGIGNLFKGLLSMAVPGAGFLFNKGKQGIAGMNNVLNDFTRNMRKGFDTQEEYEANRQDEIDRNTIRTLENTIQKKYLDKDRSLDETQLDEKLAALKQKLGTMQNVKDDIKTISIANPEIFDNSGSAISSISKENPKIGSEGFTEYEPSTSNINKDLSDLSFLLEGSGILGIDQNTDNMRLAQTFNTANDLMGMMGATEPGKFYGTNLSDQGESLEEFREAAVKFRDAPKNTANTAQSAFDFIMNTNPNMYKDIKENKNFIQDAINQGFLESESDYINQNPLTKIDLAEGGITSLLKI